MYMEYLVMRMESVRRVQLPLSMSQLVLHIDIHAPKMLPRSLRMFTKDLRKLIARVEIGVAGLGMGSFGNLMMC